MCIRDRASYGYGVTTLVSDKSRVYKGGSWNDRAYWLTPGSRRFLEEDQALSTLGFRCAMDRMGSPEGNGRKTCLLYTSPSPRDRTSVLDLVCRLLLEKKKT